MLGMIKNSLLSTVETWPYRVLSKGEKVGGEAGGRGLGPPPGGVLPQPGPVGRCEGEREASGQPFAPSLGPGLAASPSPSSGAARLRGEGVRGRAVCGGGGGGEAVRRGLEGRGAQAPQVRRGNQRQG